MNRVKLTIIVAIIFIGFLNFSQNELVKAVNPPTQWIKEIGSFGLGGGSSVIQTADGGYALVGGRDGGFLLVKTNLSGDVEWERTYGTEAEFTSFANSVAQAEDGGYVVAGQGTPWPNFIGPNGTLFNLLKTDRDGIVQWNRTYSTETTPFIATSLIKTSDGGYAVAGYAETGHSIMSSGTGFVCLIKTDEVGNIEWKKQIKADTIYAPIHISVLETGDKGYALLTVADYTENTLPVVTNVDFWLIKTDSEGNIQWSENYGGDYTDIPSCFTVTSDGGYLLGGNTLKNYTDNSVTYFQQDALLIKTDSEGHTLWNKTYGGEGPDSIASVLESKNGGYVVANSIDLSSENLYSGTSFFKTDILGNTEWTIEYQGENQPIYHPLKNLETEDGSYVFSGFTRLDIETLPTIVLIKLTEPIAISQNYWIEKTAMTIPRYRFGTAVVDRKIYAIGGQTSEGTTGSVEAYNPTTNTWETKSPMPTPRYYFAVASYDGKIYTFGGLTDIPLQNNTYVGITEVYDPKTDSWETKTQMPTNRSAICANVVNGKIFLTGGIVYGPPPSFASNSEITEVYDPETDTWTTKTSIPNPVCSYASAVIDNKIYVIGGSNQSESYTNFNQIYNTETNSWSLGAPLPTGVRFASAGATSGEMAPKQIYVIGGSTAQFPEGSNHTQIYDPKKDVWKNGVSMPTSRSGLRIAVKDDTLYAIGGFSNEDTILAVNEQYIPLGYIPEFPAWTSWLLIVVPVSVLSLIFRNKIFKNHRRVDK